MSSRLCRAWRVMTLVFALDLALCAAPTVTLDPFRLAFPEESLPTVSCATSSSLFVVSEGRQLSLRTVRSIPSESTTSRWTAECEDGRTATISLHREAGGAYVLEFELDGKGEFETLGVALAVTEDEGFYGLMERVVQGSEGLSWTPGMTQGLNLRGQTVELYTLPTVSLYAPFFVSSRGYGVFVDSDWPGTYRFGVDAYGGPQPTRITIEQEGPTLRLVLFPGPEPLDTVEAFARRTGLPMMPPDFLLGPGRWRDVVWDLSRLFDGTPYDGPYNAMVVEDILMMDALGIPCTWYVADRPWAEGTFGYGDMVFDEKRFPEFTEMVAWLEQRGIATLLWLGPWVMDAQRTIAVERGFDVSPSIPYLPNAALVDFTNDDALDWWATELMPLFETGISGFKLDRGEEKTPDGQFFRGTYADGTSFREGHNAYPMWFARAAAEAADRAGVEPFANIYRAGWTGSSQYTTAWGGDTDPSSWGLRSAILAAQRAAVLNTPIWGSDTGGYNERPPRETLARWLAFSAFCPIMEVGPTANLAPWAWLPDTSEETLSQSGYVFDTVYDEDLLAIWSLYAELHRDLIDYTREQARRASERGTPIIRPMILAFPEDGRFIDTSFQYLYGPDLLVRPIWEEGAEQIRLLIPEGTWRDAWSGQSHVGPTAIDVDTPLHVVPVLVRDGASIDLGSLPARWLEARQRVAQPHLAPLIDRMKTEVDP